MGQIASDRTGIVVNATQRAFTGAGVGEAQVTATLPAGYATRAAILIAGAAVLILWTPDKPPGLCAVPLTAAGAVGATSGGRANDLGLSNFAYNLPVVVGPLIAGVVLALMNTDLALSAVAGVVTLAAAATVTRA